jgi:hypothetical protein
MPEPMKDAPHQDAGRLVNGFISDVQVVGGGISSLMDKPLDATIKVEGPHRIISNAGDFVAGKTRDVIARITA